LTYAQFIAIRPFVRALLGAVEVHILGRFFSVPLSLCLGVCKFRCPCLPCR
jgi:hypothetical protein